MVQNEKPINRPMETSSTDHQPRSKGNSMEKELFSTGGSGMTVHLHVEQ